MDSVRAATVAIRSSGQMMVVMIEAGTTMPPMPRPARTRRPQSVWRLSTRATAREPQPMMEVSLLGAHDFVQDGEREREREKMTRLTSRHDNRRGYHQFAVV